MINVVGIYKAMQRKGYGERDQETMNVILAEVIKPLSDKEAIVVVDTFKEILGLDFITEEFSARLISLIPEHMFASNDLIDLMSAIKNNQEVSTLGFIIAFMEGFVSAFKTKIPVT